MIEAEMKISEFYEKYWKVKNAKGEMVSPPSLTQEEKDFVDACYQVNHKSYVRLMKGRQIPISVDCAVLHYEMSKPEYKKKAPL